VFLRAAPPYHTQILNPFQYLQPSVQPALSQYRKGASNIVYMTARAADLKYSDACSAHAVYICGTGFQPEKTRPRWPWHAVQGLHL